MLTMSFRHKLRREIKMLVLATLYFGAWIGLLAVIKKLVLAEYGIEFKGLLVVVVGILLLAKVVLVLEHVSLGKWLRTRPALVDIILRTTLCALGVFVLLVLERTFEGRHEHGGFVPSLVSAFQHVEIHHALANTIWISVALLGYNALSVVRCHLGVGGLLQLFLSPLPEATRPKPAEASAPLIVIKPRSGKRE
jgi:hypothetical protein